MNRSSLTVYDLGEKPSIRCEYIEDKVTTSTMDNKTLDQCPWEHMVTPEATCLYKYINYTLKNGGDPSKSIGIGHFNWKWDQSCRICDPRFNSRYQDYCVLNDLLKPFLGYNSFVSEGHKSSDLKFIVFLCTVLHDQKSCHQLANLCVLSHHSFYKYSPCRRFLMSQTSSLIYSMDHLLQSQDQTLIQVQEPEETEIPAVTPFLYFSKGKETVRLLQQPIAVSGALMA